MKKWFSAVAGFGFMSVAAASGTWDLAANWAPPANPNGAWSFYEFTDGSYSALPWFGPTSSYGVAAEDQVFITRNESGVRDFGIDPGKVSLEADWGTPVVRWTAPSAGTYAVSVRIGGSTESGPGGFGNNFAANAGLDVNGTSRASDSFVGNVAAWNVTVTLAAGEYVQAFVVNPGFAAGGNTQTEFLVSTVPEPASWLLLAGGMLVLRRRRHRP